MKKIIIIAVASLLFFALTQICGLSTCKAQAQTNVKTKITDEPKTVKLKITGLTCAGCSNHVATTLKALDGVVEQNVQYPGDVATVKYNPSKTSVADIIKAIENIGYKAVAVSEKSTGKQD